MFACESPHSVAMWGCDDEPRTGSSRSPTRCACGAATTRTRWARCSCASHRARRGTSRGAACARGDVQRGAVPARASAASATCAPWAAASGSVAGRTGTRGGRSGSTSRTTTRWCPSSNGPTTSTCGVRRRLDPVGRRAPRLGAPRRVRRAPRSAIGEKVEARDAIELVDPRGLTTSAAVAPAPRRSAGSRRGAAHRLPHQRGQPADRAGLHGLHASCSKGSSPSDSGRSPCTATRSPCCPRPADRAMLEPLPRLSRCRQRPRQMR